jgi:uncharacterized protein (DUF924 family)
MKITLTVAYVGFGGNTGNGEYFFCYDTDAIILNENDTQVEFVFSSATSSEFKMKDFVTTDVNDQFKESIKAIDNRSLQVMNRNSRSQLCFVSILVLDKKRNKIMSCDPQVVNNPP